MRIQFHRDWNRLEVPQMANLCTCGPFVHIFKNQTLQSRIFFLTQTCIFLVHLVQRFFMVKFDNKVFKNSKKSQNSKKQTKKKFCIFNFRKKVIKCMHHLPEVHRNCICKSFWSTFLALLFERACCSSLNSVEQRHQCTQDHSLRSVWIKFRQKEEFYDVTLGDKDSI